MTITTAVPARRGGAHGAVQPFQSVPVQPYGRLVQGQHGRLAGQHRGQGEQPLLRGGQFGRVDGLVSRGEADGGQRRPRPALGFGLPEELPESERGFPQDGPFEELVPGVLEKQSDRGRDCFPPARRRCCVRRPALPRRSGAAVR